MLICTIFNVYEPIRFHIYDNTREMRWLNYGFHPYFFLLPLLHADLYHFLINMLVLMVLTWLIRDDTDSKTFLIIFISSYFLSSLIELVMGNMYFVGSSNVILSVAVFYFLTLWNKKLAMFMLLAIPDVIREPQHLTGCIAGVMIFFTKIVIEKVTKRQHKSI